MRSILMTLVFLVPSVASAQQAKSGLLRAEELYLADNLFEAEKIYKQVLQGNSVEDCRKSYDRLLAIYNRLARPDAAVQMGLKYQDWLRQVRDTDRYNEVSIELAGCYLVLGHYPRVKELLEPTLKTPISAAKQLTGWMYLAQVHEKLGDRNQAQTCWSKVQEIALTQLADSRLQSFPKVQMEYVWRLAESYTAQNQPAKAIDQLNRLLPIQDRLKDGLSKRDTLRMLAENHIALQQWSAAQKCLTQALQLHEQQSSSERITAGNLMVQLAETLDKQGQNPEAGTWRNKAIEEYQTVLKNPEAGQREVAGAVAAFWKLQALYVSSSQFRKALQLTEAKSEEWAEGQLLQTRLKSERGTLEMILGAYSQARDRLRLSVMEMERQQPANLIELTRVYNNLAIVELATQHPKQAESLGQKTLEIYRKNQMPCDTVLIETYNVLGTCAAQRGDYAVAIEHFRDGVTRCEKLGRLAAEQECSLLLNIALLHKSQGDLEEAMKYSNKACQALQKAEKVDRLAVVALQAAMANMHATRGQIQEAYNLSKEIIDVCQKYEIDRGPLIVTARHCQGLYHLKKREFTKAEEIWNDLRTIQEQEKLSLLLPRTLNYLALTAELQQDLPKAEAHYRKADSLQRNSSRSFPVTYFITLWGLANVLEKQDHRIEARQLLEQAISLAEKARLTTYGDSQQRATFFAQFAPVFDQMIYWSIQDGDFRTAFLSASRGRSRTLLDQLQMANVDPRQSLKGTKAEKLLAEEADLLKQISSLRAQAQLIPSEAVQSQQAKTILTQYDTAQQKYAEVYREILNASPIYRSLMDQATTADTIPKIQQAILGSKKVLLVYHIGKERSQVFLVNGKDSRIDCYPLSVPADIATRLTIPDPLSSSEVLRGTTRGMSVKKKASAPVAAPEKVVRSTEQKPLSQFVARALVDHYWQEVADCDFAPTRGMVLKNKPKVDAVPTQRLDLLGEIFLPAVIRNRLKELNPETLVVVPDGPLHKLPLEAMLIEVGDKPKYVLDELPPIVYAPSTTILTLLADRPVSKRTDLSLLTISNPAYPQGKEEASSSESHFLSSINRMPLLQGSAKEAEQIRRYFDPSQVTMLEGTTATEKQLVDSLRGKRFVHIAAHGFADDKFGNLFGAIALTPPRTAQEATPDNDGFLSLHEIYRLRLQNCELAVLSACVTNVGPQQPLEAGVTLANGFLTAGARRVIASHWNVDDQATSELMSRFFAEVTDAVKKNQPISYAHALQNARKKVRDELGFRSPYYWAPFVLIGPGE